jgi:acyl-coenzyme A synthetase/AMP-(fatty) acid ligase
VFDSIRSVISGTAPLDPDLADAFSARYGVPVLTSYGATEFGGGVAGWNFADHERFGAAKRGSVGRAHAGCDLRIVDPERGAELALDQVGLLEVRAAQLGTADWVRTTDLARLDADGFLWIVGRADQTILRGGYKVQPEVVRAALERDPGVVEAAVVGIDEPRLGAVPVAVVQRRPGHEIDEAALLADAGAHLARYEVPVAIGVVDELPRTASGKADLAAVRAMFAHVSAGSGTRAEA